MDMLRLGACLVKIVFKKKKKKVTFKLHFAKNNFISYQFLLTKLTFLENKTNLLYRKVTFTLYQTCFYCCLQIIPLHKKRNFT